MRSTNTTFGHSSGGICREQIDNVIAQLQALKGHPSILTYDQCQVQFPWDKAANQPA